MTNHSSHSDAAPHQDTATRLALERTWLAHERTLMAWVRTALSAISFGFAIAKFFQYLEETPGRRPPVVHPRAVGILMITIGLAALALASVQHVRMVRTLRRECPGLPPSLAGMMAGLLALLGTLALAGALL
jgi:putative membrane protein